MDSTTIEFVFVAWVEALQACQDVNAKVYPWGRAPQRTVSRPFILWHRVAKTRVRSLTGPSGVCHALIQLDVVARDPLAVRRLADSIRESIEALPQGYQMGGRTVQVAIVEDDRDAEDADVSPQHGDEQTEHRAVLEVKVWFVEN